MAFGFWRQLEKLTYGGVPEGTNNSSSSSSSNNNNNQGLIGTKAPPAREAKRSGNVKIQQDERKKRQSRADLDDQSRRHSKEEDAISFQFVSSMGTAYSSARASVFSFWKRMVETKSEDGASATPPSDAQHRKMGNKGLRKQTTAPTTAGGTPAITTAAAASVSTKASPAVVQTGSIVSPQPTLSTAFAAPHTPLGATLPNNSTSKPARNWKNETILIWMKPLSQLPVFTDLPRLAPYINVVNKQPHGKENSNTNAKIPEGSSVFKLIPQNYTR